MKSIEDRPGPLTFYGDYAAFYELRHIELFLSSDGRPNSKTETLLLKLKMAKKIFFLDMYALPYFQDWGSEINWKSRH